MRTRQLNTAEEIGVEAISPLVGERRFSLGANATDCCFSKDGRLCAVALGDGSVATIEAGDESGATLRKFPLHKVAAVAVRALGDGFVSAGQDGRVVLFHGADGSQQDIRAIGDRWIESLDVHEGEGRIAVAAGHEVLVFDKSGSAIARFPALASTISDIAFDATGNRIAASHYHGATVFNLETGKSDLTLEWKGSHIAVSWSPKGRYLATATQEKELHIWDLVTMKDFRMGGYPRKIHHMAWTPDGQVMGCSGADVITAWSFEGAGPGRRPPVEIGFVFGGTVSIVAAHPLRPLLAGGFTSGNVQIGATRKGEAIAARARTGTPVSAMAWSPSGRELAAADGTGLLSLFTIPDEIGVR